MSSTTFFFFFVPLLSLILLAVNLIFAPHNPYMEKNSAFECGFSSFLGQNRTQFSISFFIFALLFLLFDLEILLVYPYLVSAYVNEIYGLAIMLIFLLALTLGFVFELGKKALTIDSRQVTTNSTARPISVSTLNNVSVSNLQITVSSLYPASMRLSYIGVKAKTCKRLFSVSSYLASPRTLAELEKAQEAINEKEKIYTEISDHYLKVDGWVEKRAAEGNNKLADIYREHAEEIGRRAGVINDELDEEQGKLNAEKNAAKSTENSTDPTPEILASGATESTSEATTSAASEATTNAATAAEATTNATSFGTTESTVIATIEAVSSLW